MKTLCDVLEDAECSKIAVGHFNISDIVTLKAVAESARELNAPVLVGVSEGERDLIGVRQVALLVRGIRDDYDLPIFQNADHTHSLAKALEAAALIRPLWPQPNAASVVPPQPSPGPLFLRYFQPLAPPDPLPTVAAYRPSRLLQQRRALLIPVTTILAGQGDPRRGQLVFISSLDRFVSLRSSPLPQQPAGVPFAHPVLAFGTLPRTTSPLRA
jgi:fructose-bisphosphate aldolase class II